MAEEALTLEEQIQKKDKHILLMGANIDVYRDQLAEVSNKHTGSLVDVKMLSNTVSALEQRYATLFEKFTELNNNFETLKEKDSTAHSIMEGLTKVVINTLITSLDTKRTPRFIKNAVKDALRDKDLNIECSKQVLNDVGTVWEILTNKYGFSDEFSVAHSIKKAQASAESAASEITDEAVEERR